MAGLFLAPTTDKLQLVTSAAASVDVVAEFVDFTAGAATPKDPQVTAITTATTTDIVAAPAASTIRNIKTLTARNKDASLAVDVTVLLDRSGTDYERHKTTLQPGECLEFIEEIGFFTLANVAKLDVKRRLTADYTNATTAFTDITGLSVPVLAGKHYNFECHLIHISNATTTGAQFAVNGPAMTAMILSTIDTVTASVTASVHSAGTVAALETAATAQTTGSAAQALAILSGWINPSAAGTFVMRGKSEVAVASGLIVKAGSWLRLWEADN